MVAVTGYKIILGSGKTGNFGRRVELRLMGNDGGIATIYFRDAPSDVKPGHTVGPNRYPTIELPMSAYAATVDMLRNEAPLSFFMGTTEAIIYTGDEPVGEGDA